MNKENEIIESINKFAKDKFPENGPFEHLVKLRIEAKEAILDTSDIKEYSDCLLTIFAAAGSAGFSYKELIDATCDKLNSVLKRNVWIKLPNGTYQHINNDEIQFKCPYNDFECTEYDSTSATLLTQCINCKNYKQ